MLSAIKQTLDSILDRAVKPLDHPVATVEIVDLVKEYYSILNGIRKSANLNEEQYHTMDGCVPFYVFTGYKRNNITDVRADTLNFAQLYWNPERKESFADFILKNTEAYAHLAEKIRLDIEENFIPATYTCDVWRDRKGEELSKDEFNQALIDSFNLKRRSQLVVAMDMSDVYQSLDDLTDLVGELITDNKKDILKRTKKLSETAKNISARLECQNGHTVYKSAVPLTVLTNYLLVKPSCKEGNVDVHKPLFSEFKINYGQSREDRDRTFEAYISAITHRGIVPASDFTNLIYKGKKGGKVLLESADGSCVIRMYKPLFDAKTICYELMGPEEWKAQTRQLLLER